MPANFRALPIKYIDKDGARVTREYPQFSTLDEFLADLEQREKRMQAQGQKVVRQLMDSTDAVISSDVTSPSKERQFS